MRTRTLLRAIGLLVLLSHAATAQENQDPPPAVAGAYDLFGTLKAGYRFVSVNAGDQSGPWFENNAANLFHEQFLLVPSDSSPTIPQMVPLSLELFGERREGESGFFDQIFLNGEMNPTVVGGSLRLRQFDAYEFNIGFHRVNYFMDRYDSLFTDLRRYDSHRNDLRASLNVAATDFLGVEVGYRGVGHGGTIRLGRPMFVEGAPSGVVLVADTRNYYMMEFPRTDWNSDIFGSINATFPMLSISAGGGYNSFTEDYSVSQLLTADSLPLNFRDTNNRPTGANSFGIVGDMTARERMFNYEHTEGRETKGPYAFGQIVATPLEMLSLTADVRFDQLEMTNAVKTDQLLEYRKTTNARTFKFYRALYEGAIENTLDRMRASLVATVTPIPEVGVTAGWRMDNTEIVSTGDYTLEFDTTTSTATQDFVSALKDSITHMEWHQRNDLPTQTFFGNVNIAPMKDLVLNAGVRFVTRTPDASRREEDELDSVYTTNLSKKTTELGLDFGASYRPMPALRLRGRVELINRKAEFGEDSIAGGPEVGTEADLEPRTTPENILRLNGSVDYEITDGLNAGVRFSMFDGKSDLNQSMFVVDGPGGNVELVNKGTTISGGINYRIGAATHIRFNAEARTHDFSIPMTFTRGQLLPVPLFPVDPTARPVTSNRYDSSTVIISQTTDDIFLDFGASTRLIDALTIGAGVTFMDVKGGSTLTPDVVNKTSTPTQEGDVTRTGGPFSRILINGNLGYDITRQFGIAFDMTYAIQNSEEVIEPAAGKRYYGYDDYNGLAAVFSLVLSL